MDDLINNEIDLAIFASENLLKQESKIEDNVQNHKNNINKLESELTEIKKEIKQLNNYVFNLSVKSSFNSNVSKKQDLSENIEFIRKNINRDIENSNVVSIYKKKNDIIKLLNDFIKEEPNNIKENFEAALSSLQDIEKKVILHRFQVYLDVQTNIKTNFILSYEDISYKVGYSPTWVRIKYLHGLRKMKHPSRTRKIIKSWKNIKDFVKKNNISKEDFKNYVNDNLYLENLIFSSVFGSYIHELD
jgi:hypothetical protein